MEGERHQFAVTGCKVEGRRKEKGPPTRTLGLSKTKSPSLLSKSCLPLSCRGPSSHHPLSLGDAALGGTEEADAAFRSSSTSDWSRGSFGILAKSFEITKEARLPLHGKWILFQALINLKLTSHSTCRMNTDIQLVGSPITCRPWRGLFNPALLTPALTSTHRHLHSQD